MLRLTVTLRMVRYKNVLLKSNFIQANFKKKKNLIVILLEKTVTTLSVGIYFFSELKKKIISFYAYTYALFKKIVISSFTYT